MNKIMDELIKLKQENPDLEIMPFTHYEVVCGDEFDYWKGDFENMEIDYYWEFDDIFYVGEEDILEAIGDILYNADNVTTEEDYTMTPKEFCNKKFDELEKKGEIRKAILIYIGV